MQKRILWAALVAAPLAFAAAETPAAEPASTAPRAGAASSIPQAKLDRIRASLVAQIAVWEASEQAMRAPTPGESTAFATPSPGATQYVVPLPRGGIALRPDLSHASLAIAVRGADGKVGVTHDASPKAATEPAKGATHAH